MDSATRAPKRVRSKGSTTDCEGNAGLATRHDFGRTRNGAEATEKTGDQSKHGPRIRVHCSQESRRTKN